MPTINILRSHFISNVPFCWKSMRKPTRFAQFGNILCISIRSKSETVPVWLHDCLTWNDSMIYFSVEWLIIFLLLPITTHFCGPLSSRKHLCTSLHFSKIKQSVLMIQLIIIDGCKTCWQFDQNIIRIRQWGESIESRQVCMPCLHVQLHSQARKSFV